MFKSDDWEDVPEPENVVLVSFGSSPYIVPCLSKAVQLVIAPWIAFFVLFLIVILVSWFRCTYSILLNFLAGGRITKHPCIRLRVAGGFLLSDG